MRKPILWLIALLRWLSAIARWLHAILKWLSPLLVDGKSKRISLARVAFWAVLAVSMLHYAAFNAMWLSLITALLAYAFGSKVLPNKPTDE